MNEAEPTCSFCQQPKSKVEKLIVAAGQAAICNRCVALCFDVLRKEGIDMTVRDQPPKKENDPE